MTSPHVSVLMSVYNGESYLAQAVDSILGQSYTDFEFIIIDDGSTDNTAALLAAYEDPRLRLSHQANHGLARSLNRALAQARGELLARMDADDIALPQRLARQVAFMETHPEVGVLGTAALFRSESSGQERRPPVLESDTAIRANFIRGNPIVHSSVMVRRALLLQAGGYDDSYPFAQDYELWIRLAGLTQLANLAEVLLVHREHAHTVTQERLAWRHWLRSVWIRIGLRYKAYRSQPYPPTYLLYLLQPILFAIIERSRLERDHVPD